MKINLTFFTCKNFNLSSKGKEIKTESKRSLNKHFLLNSNIWSLRYIYFLALPTWKDLNIMTLRRMNTLIAQILMWILFSIKKNTHTNNRHWLFHIKMTGGRQGTHEALTLGPVSLQGCGFSCSLDLWPWTTRCLGADDSPAHWVPLSTTRVSPSPHFITNLVLLSLSRPQLT